MVKHKKNLLSKYLLISGVVLLLIAIVGIAVSVKNTQQSVIGVKDMIVKKALSTSIQCRTCGIGEYDTQQNPFIDKTTKTGISRYVTIFEKREIELPCDENNVKSSGELIIPGDFLKGCKYTIGINRNNAVWYSICNENNECGEEKRVQMDTCSGSFFSSSGYCTNPLLTEKHVPRYSKMKIKVLANIDIIAQFHAEQFCLFSVSPTEGHEETVGCFLDDLKNSNKKYNDYQVSLQDRKNLQQTSGALGLGLTSVQKLFYGYGFIGDPVDIVKSPVNQKLYFLKNIQKNIVACDVEKDEKSIFVVNENSCEVRNEFECIPSTGNCNIYTAKIEKTQVGSTCQEGQPPNVLHVYKNGKYQQCQYVCKSGKFVQGDCLTVETPAPVQGSQCKADEQLDYNTKTCNSIKKSDECVASGRTFVTEEIIECGLLCSFKLSKPTTIKIGTCKPQTNLMTYLIFGAIIIIALLLITQPKKPQQMMTQRRMY